MIFFPHVFNNVLSFFFIIDFSFNHIYLNPLYKIKGHFQNQLFYYERELVACSVVF